MDFWLLITGLGVVIGIVAGIVQVVDFLQKRREHNVQLMKSTVSAEPLSGTSIPSNLPSRGNFVGREEEKIRVREALASRWPLICIDGIGGIGKTALAIEVAGECLHASRNEVRSDEIPVFDGFIWTTAKDRELVLNDILDIIARTLDYPGIAQQPPEEKQESVRRLLQNGRYLLVVDNFETVTDAAVSDFLLHLPEPSKVLVTSREQKMRQAWAVSLKGMDQVEALDLIRSEARRLGLILVEKGGEQTFLRLYKATGGAPLAIKWAMGQIKQRGQSFYTVLDYLYEAEGDLFENIFGHSWGLLSKNAKHVLLVMPIFAASASKGAIEAASDVHKWDLDEALGLLVQMWLVEVSEELDMSERRYSVHPLTRAFADRETRNVSGFVENAYQRAAAWLLEFISDAQKDLAAFDRIEVELPNSLKVIEWCYTAGHWEMVLDLVRLLITFLKERGYWDEALLLGGWALEAAEVLDDPDSQAFLCVDPFGWVYRHRGRLGEAEQWCEKGLGMFRELGNERRGMWAELALGDVAWQAGDIKRAQAIFEDLLPRLRESKGNEAFQMTALIHLSRVACSLGEFERAEELALDGQKLSEKIQDARGRMASIHRLGYALLYQDRLQEAEQLFFESLQMNKRHFIRHGIAWNKAAFAQLEERRHEYEAALQFAREAAELHHKLGMKREAEEMSKLVKRLERKLKMG